MLWKLLILGWGVSATILDHSAQRDQQGLRRVLLGNKQGKDRDEPGKQDKQDGKVGKDGKEEKDGKEAPTRCYSSTIPQSEDKLGIAALSHINVVVSGDIDEASAYYQRILGFLPASNDAGLMDYRNITLESFCLDAGFADGKCRVDIIFLKHVSIHMYLELFKYYEPVSTYPFQLRNTNDVGGVRHVALEVLNATTTYFTLRQMNHEGTFLTNLEQGPLQLTPFPYYFFYWIDKYGVQWEFEQGRPVKYFEIAGITG
eukprot:gb/GEZN01012024.1/.p1 GENE.gb/GEZN01012024.1/~~gb/GEZN01012024.1/.p1  ORF type:complete len:258 (-),score=46.63 gb/GEZN01012024.1/:291-1064(-)